MFPAVGVSTVMCHALRRVVVAITLLKDNLFRPLAVGGIFPIFVGINPPTRHALFARYTFLSVGCSDLFSPLRKIFPRSRLRVAYLAYCVRVVLRLAIYLLLIY